MNIKKTAAMAVVLVMLITAAACASSVPSTAPTLTPAVTSETTPIPTETSTPSTAPSATAAVVPSATTAEPTAAPAPLTVDDNPLIYNSDYVDVQISCPEISGMQDAAAQTGINDGVYNYLLNMAHSVEDASKRDAKGSGTHGVYRIDSEFSVKRNDGRVLSVKIDITTFEGGANVATDATFVNVINGKKVAQPTLEELFKGEFDYEAILNEKVSELIAADPEGDIYSFDAISSDQWYYLTNSSLVLVFPSYSIAPGAYGLPEFAIPFADISRYLIKEIQ